MIRINIRKGIVVSYINENLEEQLGVIISNKECLKYSPTFQIAPLTEDDVSFIKYKGMSVDVVNETVINRSFIVNRIDRLNGQTLWLIEKEICRHHGIGYEINQNSPYKKGEIYYADIPESYGSIQCGRRPVLIISNEIINDNVQIIPLTTQDKKNLPTHYDISSKNSFVLKDSTLLIEAERQLHTNYLTGKLGELNNIILKEIDDIVLFQHGIIAAC